MQLPEQLEIRCRNAVDKLDRASRLHAREIEKEVDQIERDIVLLRDAVIDELRHKASPQLNGGLEGVNAALSLIVSVEYPVTGIRRSALEQARDVLNKLVRERCLAPDPQ